MSSVGGTEDEDGLEWNGNWHRGRVAVYLSMV